MKSSLVIAPFAGDDARRRDVIAFGRSGLDYIDVRGDGRTLVVAFFGPLPQVLGREHFAITGGDRVMTIRVTSMRIASDEPDAEGVVTLRLDRAGDGSTYTLRVIGVPDVDPLYASLAFTFDRDNARLTDCDCATPSPPELLPAPQIDYLAKDYATFRRLLLDRASLVMPDWSEQHIPDLNVTLIELLAYVGDGLSYFQDAVATEAYLSTARKRVSVRRHARLLDYHMHDGCNARAWISLSTNADLGPIDPRTIAFSTTATAAAPAEFFEPIGGGALHVHAAHGPMRLYAWGNHTCALAAGATAATLRDAWEGPEGSGGGKSQRALRRLEAGAYVLFESVVAIVDGQAVAGDPRQRHVVRLTHVRRDIDPLYDTPIVEIAWASADRLPFALTIVAPDPANATAPPRECSLVWGNLIAVDHGRSLTAPETLAPVPPDPSRLYRPQLAQPTLTFAEHLIRGTATQFDVRDPRSALPQITELVTIDEDGDERRWSPVPDLLASGPSDTRFVVEVDENGIATLRFGDGILGRKPPAGATVRARYCTGNGVAGNVGAESIVNIEWTGTSFAGADLRARNPLPARGGTEPESVDDVRALAPSASLLQTQRAIAPADYATIAQRDPRLQRAAAVARWTGSRTIVRVALDPLGGEDPDAGLLADVATVLEGVRRIGHDVEVVAATYVPLNIVVDVTVKNGYQRGQVRSALDAILGSTALADGTLGFFHPDALTFGGSITQSHIIARAFAVAGVENVTLGRLERLYAPTPGVVPSVLSMGDLEIAQLDGDAARPERGVLTLRLRGGR